MMEEFIRELESDRVRKLALRGIRMDRRKLDEYREVSVEKGILYNADGSAIARIGDTIVAAGVKFELGTPYPDTPDKGGLVVDIELLPHSSPTVEPGPPDEYAIEVARVVDRAIRESGSVPLEELVIREGELVYVLFVDMRVLDDDGNLFDTASLAAAAALMDSKIPRVEEDTIVRGEYERPLGMKEVPLLTTFAKVGKVIMVDPTKLEEYAMDARLSVGTVDDGSVTALQKGGEGWFTRGEVEYIIDTATKLSERLRRVVRDED